MENNWIAEEKFDRSSMETSWLTGQKFIFNTRILIKLFI